MNVTRIRAPQLKPNIVLKLGCVDNYRKWIIVAAK